VIQAREISEGWLLRPDTTEYHFRIMCPPGKGGVAENLEIVADPEWMQTRFVPVGPGEETP
jgi:hypothetical protein